MNQEIVNSERIQTGKRIFIVICVFLLPGAHVLFDVLFVCVPGLVFYYLYRYGWIKGGRELLFGALIALALAGVSRWSASSIMLALMFVPAGCVLAHSATRGDSPALAGLKGFVALFLVVMVATTLIGNSEDKHFYPMLLLSLEQSLDEALGLYQKSETLPAETLYLLAQSFSRIKEWLPRLLPSSLISIALTIIWGTLALGNRLIQRHTGQSPWPEYRYWKLPEKLVWMVIGAAGLVLLPIPAARDTGLNLLIITGVLYFFQGLAIALFFVERWKIPLLMRSLLLMIFFFQSLGALFLSVLGITDVWFDFRQRYGESHDSHAQKAA